MVPDDDAKLRIKEGQDRMDKSEMMQELDRAHEGLQHLRGVPCTRDNLAILLDALQVMQAAYQLVAGLPDGKAEKGGDGRDEDGIRADAEGIAAEGGEEAEG